MKVKRNMGIRALTRKEEILGSVAGGGVAGEYFSKVWLAC